MDMDEKLEDDLTVLLCKGFFPYATAENMHSLISYSSCLLAMEQLLSTPPDSQKDRRATVSTFYLLKSDLAKTWLSDDIQQSVERGTMSCGFNSHCGSVYMSASREWKCGISLT